jgi:putative hydrolase of the HAD superfamily
MPLVFDLDDTLYDESTFVDSGFHAVAAMLAGRLDATVDDLHMRMRVLLAEHGRGAVFDLLLEEHGAASPALVQECVAAYRAHEPDIRLADPVRTMLERLAPQRLYLVTDGDPDVQARKILALGLSSYFVETYRTWAFGRESGKPSLHCFELIRAREGCEWADLTYIGDDPSKDFVSLRRIGARTVRVHTGRCADVVAEPGFDAELHVTSVTDVPALLGIDGPGAQDG